MEPRSEKTKRDTPEDRSRSAAERPARWRRLQAALGSCHDPSGAADVVERHDEYLPEAYELLRDVRLAEEQAARGECIPHEEARARLLARYEA